MRYLSRILLLVAYLALTLGVSDDRATAAPISQAATSSQPSFEPGLPPATLRFFNRDTPVGLSWVPAGGARPGRQ